MFKLSVITDISECQKIWERVIPEESIFDLWEVRDCFQRHFKRPPYFVVAEKDGNTLGLLPLSWIDESKTYGYFPGETWNGKTWIEQNRIYATNDRIMNEFFKFVKIPYYLRYIIPVMNQEDNYSVDEIGYIFKPEKYEYNMNRYFEEFSGKSRKRLRRELESFKEQGANFRYNELDDFSALIRLNISRFGNNSYFADKRFRDSFYSLMYLLNDKEYLRITTILIKDEIAAVDMGCIYNGVYTLLAGGTNVDFPGVAKLININHMDWACKEKIKVVDFLCGDFFWKKQFHLTPRPLYLISNEKLENKISTDFKSKKLIYAK
jgi:hypothetical protein